MTSDQLRLEYKLDLILVALQAAGMLPHPNKLPQLKDLKSDMCPVCGHFIHLSIDTIAETIVRSCGCQSPVSVVSGISKLHQTPAPSPKRKDRHAEDPDRDEISPDPTSEGSGSSRHPDSAGPSDRSQGPGTQPGGVPLRP